MFIQSHSYIIMYVGMVNNIAGTIIEPKITFNQNSRPGRLVLTIEKATMAENIVLRKVTDIEIKIVLKKTRPKFTVLKTSTYPFNDQFFGKEFGECIISGPVLNELMTI
ncbi:protein of unknown function [Vibrio tapetis subsp. tapetis]|uniref:Uncharacterized protein n=1 Tax=Vibrio tapetis subsp. tapetis TaxID=1671868 RepID=A0A2N8ZMS2_9VIBR|nr:protein of unknown function [Vibrio tapetis subsp. tapetis]